MSSAIYVIANLGKGEQSGLEVPRVGWLEREEKRGEKERGSEYYGEGEGERFAEDPNSAAGGEEESGGRD